MMDTKTVVEVTFIGLALIMIISCAYLSMFMLYQKINWIWSKHMIEMKVTCSKCKRENCADHFCRTKTALKQSKKHDFMSTAENVQYFFYLTCLMLYWTVMLLVWVLSCVSFLGYAGVI